MTGTSHLGLDIWDQAREIRSGRLTATELLEECTRNIERLDEAYNVFISLERGRALENAAALDDELARGLLRGPLHGIPIAIKDNVDTNGVATTAGSRILAGNYPDEDAPLVTRLREAGAVIVGKTNMDEFAYGFSTENEHYGSARNPYDPDRVAGGSSGGSALAVALSMSSGAIGTDTNGSIRVPASFCGLVGLRPTYGRVSPRGIVPLAPSYDQAGPIAHSARDAALILSAITGHDYAAAIGDPLPKLRVGAPRWHFFEGADPEVISRVEAALEGLASEGHDLTEIVLDKTHSGRKWASLITAFESAEAVTDEMLAKPGLFDQKVLGRLKDRLGISRSDYEEAKVNASDIWRELIETLETVDVIVTPTTPLPPILIGEGSREFDGVTMPVSRYLGRCTSVFGMAHLPAVSVPCGFTSDGLPVGMQLVSAPFEEVRLLKLARLVEQMTGLANVRPPSPQKEKP